MYNGSVGGGYEGCESRAGVLACCPAVGHEANAAASSSIKRTPRALLESFFILRLLVACDAA